MSESLGQVYMAPEKRNRFLDIGVNEGGDYSETTADMIDREIREITANEYNRALEILRSKKDILIQGAHLLLEREKIDGDEIRALIRQDAGFKATHDDAVTVPN